MGVEGMDGGGFEGDGLDDAFTTEADPTEAKGGAGAGTETDEAPAETALSRLMKDRGIDDAAAARLLEERHEEAEEERQQETQERISQAAQQQVNQQFPQLFQKALGQYVREDAGFRRNLRAMLDRTEGRSAMGGGAGAGNDGETIDPTTRLVQEMHARMMSQGEELAALKQRLEQGAERETQERSYRDTVGREVDKWARKNVSPATEYGEEIMSDLTARENQAGGRSFKSEREVRQFLSARADHYRKLEEKFSAKRGGGNKQRTTRPLGGNTGTTRGQAPKERESTSLRVPDITRDVLADMAGYRDAGGE